MNERVNEIVSELNAIQKKAFADLEFTKEDNRRFRALCREMRILGFKPSYRRVREPFGRTISIMWTARPINPDRFGGGWKRDEHEKNCNIECTTRAIYFVLEHTIPYQTIRNTQNARARSFYGSAKCRGWNTERIWGALLKEHGFVELNIPVWMKIRSGALAERLAGIDTRVVIHSNRHLSACYRGDVWDDWDSRKKFVVGLYVKADFADAVLKALGL